MQASFGLEDDGAETFVLTLNNQDGVDQDLLTDYEERSIYTRAANASDAEAKFEAFFGRLMEQHEYNGMRPLTLWLFQRIEDGTVV